MFKLMFSEGFKKLLRILGVLGATYAIFLILFIIGDTAFGLNAQWKQFSEKYQFQFILLGPLGLTGMIFLLFGKSWTFIVSSVLYGPKPSDEDLRDP